MATKEAFLAEEGNGETVVFDKATEKVNFELEQKSIGLTKEQLEKYRNDPFWKPLRTILFVLFWLAWVAMFGAAIAIVLISPKCAEKQKPEWWQTKASYQILTATFRDSDNDGVGDFNGITEKIDFLRKIGITTIHPSPVGTINKDEYFNAYDVTDHYKVDPRFGNEEEFAKMVETAHNRDMYVVIDLPVSTVSVEHRWFTSKSAKYFVTAKSTDPTYNHSSYYPFADGLKYRGYPTAANPVINWQNEEVRDAVNSAIRKYLVWGVDGFHIDHVSQLAFDANGNPDHDGIIDLLKNITGSINEFVAAHEDLADKKIVLFSSLKDIEQLHSKARETANLHYVIDNTFASISASSCKEGVAKCVHNTLTSAFSNYVRDGYVPQWQFSNADNSRLASRFDDETAELLTFLQLTLPGAVSVYYGQELGLKDVGDANNKTQRGIMHWTGNSVDHHGFVETDKDIGKLFFAEGAPNRNDNYESQYEKQVSTLKTFKKLAKLRQRDEALLLGTTIQDTVIDDVIVFGRHIAGEKGTATGSAFVVVLNFGNSDYEFDLSSEASEKLIPSNKQITNVEVSVVTTGVTKYISRQKLNLAENKLTVPAHQGILLKL